MEDKVILIGEIGGYFTEYCYRGCILICVAAGPILGSGAKRALLIEITGYMSG